MRRRLSFAVLVGLAVLLFCTRAPAQTTLERELGFLEAEEIEKIPLAVASRGPAIPAGQAPAVVDVITAEEIRTSGARTLAELLSQRVGIDVSLDAVVPRGLNTAPSTALVPLQNSRTLLLIDGRPSNGMVFGEFLAGRELPLEHIARIEIIRGPGSSLYGTNAMAGVINVVTKDAADLPLIGAIAEYGNFSSRRADLFGGIGGPRRNGSFFLRYYADAGADQVLRHDNTEELFASARSSLGPVTFFAEALHFREETPGTPGGETPLDRINRERYSLGASLDQRLGDQFRLGGRAYGNFYQTRFLVAQGEPRDRTVYDDDRFGQELFLTYEPWTWLAITFGGENRFEDGGASVCAAADGSVTFDCDFDRNVAAAFLEDRIQLPWDATLTAGVRYDDISSFDGRFTPRGNLFWKFHPAGSVKVGYGEAFRAPSLFELRAFQAFGAGVAGPNQNVLGNPDLGSEVVRTLDGEIAYRFSRALNARITGFYMRGSDLITQASQEFLLGIGIPLCPPLCLPIISPPAENELRFVNSDRVNVTGMELALGGVLGTFVPGELSWGVNYTFQEARSRFLTSDGDRVEVTTPLAPAHKVNVLLDYRPVRDLSIFWHTRWVDDRRTGLEDPPELASLFNHTLNLVYHVRQDLDVSLGLYNVTDDHRRDGASVLREPRAVLASIGYRLPTTPPLPEGPDIPLDPVELIEARTAVERARAAGAENLDLTSWKEAVAHLAIAEEMQRRGEPTPRVAAAAERARAAADVAREAAITYGTPTPVVEPTRPAPAPTATETVARPAPEATVPVVPPTYETRLPPGTPTIASPTPSPTQTPTPIATATPTPDVRMSRVLLLQSDGSVEIYRATAAAFLSTATAQIDLRDLGGDADRGREIISEAQGVDLIVAVGALAAALARETDVAPVLYCAVLNPERYDLATVGAAGVSYEISPAEQLRALQRALPGRNRIGVIYDPAKTGKTVDDAREAAPKLGMRIVAEKATRPEDVDFLFRQLRPNVDVLWLIADSTVVTRESFRLLAQRAMEAQIPLVAFAEAFTREGALLALYPDPAGVGRQCAALATKVLRGEVSVRQIGARTPERFACAVNRRIEGQLGLNVPKGMCADVGG